MAATHGLTRFVGKAIELGLWTVVGFGAAVLIVWLHR